MSNLGPLAGPQPGRVPMPPKGEPIARYDTYLEAQRAVDFLSDNHFPVQAVTIVGTGLQMVERVTGRLTYARVSLAGAASGAWFGLIFGIVLSMFGGTEGALLAGPLFGAAAGVLFGIFSYSLTRGRRDFTSASQIVASEYAVLCLGEQAGAARQLLSRLPGGAGRGGGASPRPGSAWSGDQGVGGPGAGGPGWPGTPYGEPPAPPPAPPASGAPTQPLTGQSGQPGQPGPASASPSPEEPALTYGEAIERQRRERAERERLEREERS
jgi:hypothetical protein